MNQAIANIIRAQIADLDFVDKIAGLVSTQYANFPTEGGGTVQKSFPLACCVTANDCKQGAYNDLCPNSQYRTVIYFEDEGISFNRYESKWKYYTSSLRLVCWINIPKIFGVEKCNYDITCSVSAKIISDIIMTLPQHPQNILPFDNVYSEVTGQVIRSNSIFAKYTYNELQTQYLLYPYDYFALDIRTDFAICLTRESEYTMCDDS